MNETVFSILSSDGNWHDYTRYVRGGGYSWDEEDLDSENTVRLKSGTLRRDKITEKINTSLSMRDMDRMTLRQLRRDLKHAPTYKAKILDPEGVIESTFYSSSVSATLEFTENGNDIWRNVSFNVIEV